MSSTTSTYNTRNTHYNKGGNGGQPPRRPYNRKEHRGPAFESTPVFVRDAEVRLCVFLGGFWVPLPDYPSTRTIVSVPFTLVKGVEKPVTGIIDNLREIPANSMAWCVFDGSHWFPIHIGSILPPPLLCTIHTTPIPVGKYLVRGAMAPPACCSFVPANPRGDYKYLNVAEIVNLAPPVFQAYQVPENRPPRAEKAERLVGASSSADRKDHEVCTQSQKYPKGGKDKSRGRIAFPDPPAATEVPTAYARTEETEQPSAPAAETPKPTPTGSVPQRSSSSAEDDAENEDQSQAELHGPSWKDTAKDDRQ